MARAMGACLSGGGSALQYGNRNGPLGCFYDSTTTAGSAAINYTAQLPTGITDYDPQPTYYGIKAWTGAQGGLTTTGQNATWPHFKDTVHNVTPVSPGDSGDVIIYSVNNEAGGHNLIMINRNLTTDHQQICTITQGSTRMNGFDAYQSVGKGAEGSNSKAAFGDYTKILSNVALAGTGNNQMWCNLKAGSVTVVVLKP